MNEEEEDKDRWIGYVLAGVIFVVSLVWSFLTREWTLLLLVIGIWVGLVVVFFAGQFLGLSFRVLSKVIRRIDEWSKRP